MSHIIIYHQQTICITINIIIIITTITIIIITNHHHHQQHLDHLLPDCTEPMDASLSLGQQQQQRHHEDDSIDDSAVDAIEAADMSVLGDLLISICAYEYVDHPSYDYYVIQAI
jgi:hypothetical protein